MSYDLESYAEITKVVNDKSYANEKHIIVKKVSINDNTLYMLNYDRSKITN